MKEKIEVLITANEYIYNIKKAIKNVSILINENKEAEAYKIIQDLPEALAWTFDAVNLTNDCLKSELEINLINDFLKEIIEAIENDDFILVGDIFNYELLPVIENLHTEIQVFLGV